MRHKVGDPAEFGTFRVSMAGLGPKIPRWKVFLGGMMHMHRHADLFQIVRAVDSASSFSSGLHRRQQQGNENTDNRNDD